MDAHLPPDPAWDAIVALTHDIINQVHTQDNNSLLAQLDTRNQKIRDYFHTIRLHSERLDGIEQRIADLLSLDERIISTCRALQSEAMLQLNSARRAERGVREYTASQNIYY